MNIILYDKEKPDKIMSKAISIIFKLVSDQYQLIIEGKTLQKTYATPQIHFWYINSMNTPALSMRSPSKSSLILRIYINIQIIIKLFLIKSQAFSQIYFPILKRVLRYTFKPLYS